jgi:hypothetical protein
MTDRRAIYQTTRAGRNPNTYFCYNHSILDFSNSQVLFVILQIFVEFYSKLRHLRGKILKKPEILGVVSKFQVQKGSV